MGTVSGVDDRPERVAWTIREAARALGISVSSVRRQIGAGHLPILRIGVSVRVPDWALQEYTRRAERPEQSA
jgi:excisionase family DNA binding protein